MRSRSYLFLLAVLVLAGLSAFFYSRTQYNLGLDVRGGVRFTFQIADLKPEQRAELPRIRANVKRILQNRVGALGGVQEGTVQDKGTDQFVVEIPGYTNVEEARKLLSTTASLKWYHARNVSTELATRRYDVGPTEKVGGSNVVTFVRHFDPEGKPIRPGDPEYLEIIQGWDLILQGDDLAEARVVPNPRGQGFIPAMRFSATGAPKIERWTRRYQNRRENLAAVLDNQVINIAPLEQGAIIREEGVIQGQFETEYVKRLVELLNSGALPVDLKELSSQKVDPTIGAQALDSIVRAGIASFIAISLFLLLYYVFPGFVALLALFLYTLFTLTVLKMLGATFSLAAIAAFIVSVGMAVDANILVFERMKEELRGGLPLNKAIHLGFKRALPAIVDSNACTILTSLVLANLGTGPVKGFASTLIIGVAISLFTAVTVTRSLLLFFVGSGIGTDPKWYGLNRQWFGESIERSAEHKPLQVIANWKGYISFSVLTILVGLLFIGMGGIKPNVEFQGGYEINFKLGERNLTSNQIVATLERNGVRGATVKVLPEQRLASVTVPETRELEAAGPAALDQLAQKAGFTKEDVAEFTKVGPTVQKETVQNAVLGVVYSALLIVVYLAIRFGVAMGGFLTGLRFSSATIVALVHDTLIVLGMAALVGYLANWQISALFITAVLTMIGFSTHDTIVIFDRIRENLRRPHPGETFENLVNRSITQSFARSINTSFTVILTLAVLLIWGSSTTDLKFFNLTMLVGIVFGTYSSIFIASPVLYGIDRWIMRSKGEDAGLMAITAKEQQFAQRVVKPAESVDAAPTDLETKAGQYGQIRRRRRASEASRSISEIDEP